MATREATREATRIPYLLLIITLRFTCGEKKMVKHKKVSKYYAHHCSRAKFSTFSQSFNTIQDGVGGGQKNRPTIFSPVTSTNVGISPQNFPILV